MQTLAPIPEFLSFAIRNGINDIIPDALLLQPPERQDIDAIFVQSHFVRESREQHGVCTHDRRVEGWLHYSHQPVGLMLPDGGVDHAGVLAYAHDAVGSPPPCAVDSEELERVSPLLLIPIWSALGQPKYEKTGAYKQ